ncbi:MAG: amidohydrolase family protein [Gemmatimonadota bacterium]
MPARLLLLLASLPATASAQQLTAFTHVRLIDGRGGAPIADATVVVRGDRITAAGAASQVSTPAGARVIDGRGMSLMPGLADMHTHLSGGWDGETADWLGGRVTMNALLYNGITSAFDPGDVTSYVRQLREEVRAGRLAGPRIFFTGPVLDGATPQWPDISQPLTTPEQASFFVRQMKSAGAVFIKAYGGLTTEMVKVLVDAAARDSMRVIADVGQRNGSLAVAQTGIAIYAHTGTSAMTDEAIRYMADHHTATITTLAVYESLSRRRFKEMSFLQQPLIKDVMSPTYMSQVTAWGLKPPTAQESRLMAFYSTALTTAARNVKRMLDAGILVVAGTDAPWPGQYYGEGLHRELELLVEAGLTPLEVITLATRNAARLVNAESEWGTVEPGKVADLLLVRGDPSTQIGDSRNIVQLMQGGKLIDRASLRYDPKRDPDYHPVDLRPH